MDKCSSDCEYNKKKLCCHRFNFNSHLVYSNGYIKFLRFYDFQIVLHFLHLIYTNRVPNHSRCNFILVTNDKNFLKSAQKEWRSRKKSKYRLEFGKDYVRSGNITINVEIIMLSKKFAKGRDYRSRVIDQLNQKYK